jgi:hypothetical protein
MEKPPEGFRATPTHLEDAEGSPRASDDGHSPGVNDGARRKRSSIIGNAPDPLAVAARMKQMSEQDRSNGPIRRKSTYGAGRAPPRRETIG